MGDESASRLVRFLCHGLSLFALARPALADCRAGSGLYHSTIFARFKRSGPHAACSLQARKGLLILVDAPVGLIYTTVTNLLRPSIVASHRSRSRAIDLLEVTRRGGMLSSASCRRSMPEDEPRHPSIQLGGTWLPAKRAGVEFVAPQTNGTAGANARARVYAVPRACGDHMKGGEGQRRFRPILRCYSTCFILV